jgi:hypothetical protein
MQDKTKQIEDKTKQNKTKQDKTNKTKQNKTKQNKTKQNEAKLSISLHSLSGTIYGSELHPLRVPPGPYLSVGTLFPSPGERAKILRSSGERNMIMKT